MYLDVRSKWVEKPDCTYDGCRIGIILFVHWFLCPPTGQSIVIVWNEYIVQIYKYQHSQMYSQMYSNLMKRHLKLIALGVKEAEAQVQLKKRDAWWWQSWQWYWTWHCHNIHCQKYHIGVSILLPTSRIGSFSAIKFWTTSRISDSSKESMSISFSLSNVLQLAPIPKRRRGRKCNLMFNFCSSHNFSFLFSHSQFSSPRSRSKSSSPTSE